MNYFAHGLPFLGDPYYLAGTALPDWLAVVDRKVRIRSRQALPLASDADPRVAALARGLLQHFRDDARFHETRAFAETSLELTLAVRDHLAPDPGFRPSFLGHLLVEVLLDATLIAEMPDRLETYYRVVGNLDPQFIQQAVARMAARPAPSLAWFVGRFSQERFLSDYLADAKLLIRLNQVMRRVQLPALPETFVDLLPAARQLVARRRPELLAGIPTPDIEAFSHG